MKRYVVYFVIINTLIGCGNSEKLINDDVLLSCVDSVEFSMADTLNYSFNDVRMTKSDSGIIFSGLTRDNDILYLRNIKGKYKKIIKFDKVGPNAIKPESFWFQSADSIFLIEMRSMKLFMINDSGEIKGKWEIPTKSADLGVYYQLGTMYKDGAMHYNSSHNIVSVPINNIDYNNEYKIPVELSYTLDGMHKPLLYCYYPDNYRELDERVEHYRQKDVPERVFIDSLVVISFDTNDSLYVYNSFTGEKIKQVYAGSRYFDESKTFEAGKSMQEYSAYFRCEPSYMALVYDKINKIYYRTVKHKQEVKNAYGELNMFYDSDWSVIVLDEEFNILNEQRIEGDGKNAYNEISIIDSRLYVYQMPDEEGLVKFKIYSLDK